MRLETYLDNIPLLHSWDGGGTWNEGGFHKQILLKLDRFFQNNLKKSARIIETGAGNSTIFFLLHGPETVVSIAPDQELFERILKFCDQNQIGRQALEYYVDGSQWVLPKMAQNENVFDFALIDGCHNWPMVMVDFYYLNSMIREGGYIMLDDVQLHTVKELCRMLDQQPEFELKAHFGKCVIYRKLRDGDLPEFSGQPYILEKNEEYKSVSLKYPYAQKTPFNQFLRKIKNFTYPNRVVKRFGNRTK